MRCTSFIIIAPGAQRMECVTTWAPCYPHVRTLMAISAAARVSKRYRPAKNKVVTHSNPVVVIPVARAQRRTPLTSLGLTLLGGKPVTYTQTVHRAPALVAPIQLFRVLDADGAHCQMPMALMMERDLVTCMPHQKIPALLVNKFWIH
jgi:hypothetical protein